MFQYLPLETASYVLYVHFTNAGIQALSNEGPIKTAQDHKIHLGANALGTFLFTKPLTPTLMDRARIEPTNSVYVVKTSSLGAEMIGEKTL